MADDKTTLHYVGEAGRRYHEGKRSISEAALPWVARLRAKKIASQIAETDVVFEFGVGFGWNLSELRCAKRIGYDISTFLASGIHRQGIEFVSQTTAIADESVNVALCHHTLEHLSHPAEVLREIRRVLRPKGKLLLFVPYEKERRYRRYNPGEPNHHLYSWNVQTLGNLVEESGFKLMEGKIGQFGYERFAANWAARLKLGATGFQVIHRMAHLIKPACEVRIVAVTK